MSRQTNQLGRNPNIGGALFYYSPVILWREHTAIPPKIIPLCVLKMGGGAFFCPHHSIPSQERKVASSASDFKVGGGAFLVSDLSGKGGNMEELEVTEESAGIAIEEYSEVLE